MQHPQYAGFIAILTGFMLQWPTLLALAMYPPPVVMYVVLVRNEEREALERFDAAYDLHATHVLPWIPAMRRRVGST